MSAVKISVDTGKCVASGQCVLLAEEPPAGERDAARQAELTCPAAAIRLADS